MVNKKLKIGRIILAMFILIMILGCASIGIFFYEISPIDKNGIETTYIIESGTTINGIYEDLEDKKIIRSALFMKIYTKFLGTPNIEAGEYKLSPSMKAKEIYDILKGGGKSTRETFSLTFREGKSVRDLIKLISDNTDITKEEILMKLKDEEYLNSLIDKYWFLTDEIKNKDIFYSLEGYLFPNTYEFFKDSSLEEIISKMLDETGKQLTPYKADIEKSNYSVHEILTLASIIELESPNSKTLDEETDTKESDRKTIAGIFTRRLEDNDSLGSCVTTYYAFDVPMGSRDLKLSEINDCDNKYNTRCTTRVGLTPGAVGNAGIKSIEAAIKPNKTDYYFFLSDKDGKIYFSKTNAEHERIGRELRENGQMLYRRNKLHMRLY